MIRLNSVEWHTNCVFYLANAGGCAVRNRFPVSTSSGKRSLENAAVPIGLGLIVWLLIGVAVYYFLYT
jgi:hypothetical protein